MSSTRWTLSFTTGTALKLRFCQLAWKTPTTLERLKKVHDRIKTYSDVYGIPVSELVAKALEEWMYVTGDLHLEILSGESGKVLPWPN